MLNEPTCGWSRCISASAPIWLGLAIILGCAAPAPSAEPTVLFLIGEAEYQTATTLPAFAAQELAGHGLRCLFATQDPADPNDFIGIEQLPMADLLVISVRRHAPTSAHLALVRAHLAAGKPLIGIRTASHAFAAAPPDDRHAGWMDFDNEILGGSYQGHYGDVPAALACAPGAAGHPVLDGVDPTRFTAQRLYRNATLAPTATALLRGRAQGAADDHFVAWVNQVGASRVFYTSLGMAEDFGNPAFRRLMTNAVSWCLQRPPPPAASPSAPAPGKP